MLALVVALAAALRSVTRSRLELTAEVFALRHQLAVLRQQAPKRLRVRRVDRVVWVLLSRAWRGWRDAVQIVSPDTVVAWHRRGFSLYWRWRSRPRRPGRPAIAGDIRGLIRRMQQANPLWGAPRIHAELFKLGDDEPPAFLIRDRDGIYGWTVRRTLQGMGIREVVTAPRSPWQNPFVERVTCSIRRECLDHVIIWNERGLRRHLRQYLAYDHTWRPHLALDKDAPIPRATQPPAMGRVVQVPEVGGLHHHYERRAA